MSTALNERRDSANAGTGGASRGQFPAKTVLGAASMKMMGGHPLFHKLASVAAALMIWSGLSVFGPGAFASAGPFSTEVASSVVSPGHVTVIHFGTATVMIPAGTFSTPVRFTVWQGPLSGFTVPSGQTAIFDFAFQVTTLSGGSVALPFSQKVRFALADKNVTSASAYYNVLADGTLTANPASLTITGSRLTHLINTDKVGWVITSPTSTGP